MVIKNCKEKQSCRYYNFLKVYFWHLEKLIRAWVIFFFIVIFFPLPVAHYEVLELRFFKVVFIILTKVLGHCLSYFLLLILLKNIKISLFFYFLQCNFVLFSPGAEGEWGFNSALLQELDAAVIPFELLWHSFLPDEFQNISLVVIRSEKTQHCILYSNILKKF